MLKKVESLTLSLSLNQIFLDGVDTRTVSLESLRNRISVVPQDTSLFDETVEYNLRLGSTSLFTSTEGGQCGAERCHRMHINITFYQKPARLTASITLGHLLHSTPVARMHTTPASPVVFYFVFTSYHHLLVSFISLYHFTLLFYFCPMCILFCIGYFYLSI